MLVYCSKGYFQSKNCMRELIASKMRDKPIIALLDPEASHGGLTVDEVSAQVLAVEGSYTKWELDEARTPDGQALLSHLFAYEPIEWNRLGHFQDVTIRLIAERLAPDAAGCTYVDRELIQEPLEALVAPAGERKHHICYSESNPGAAELLSELAATHGFSLGGASESHDSESHGSKSQASKPHGSKSRVSKSHGRLSRLTLGAKRTSTLYVTSNIHEFASSDHFLLYLTAQVRVACRAAARMLTTA